MTKMIVLSLVLLCSFLAVAQMAPFYQVNYYSHRNNAFGADAPIDIINPGSTGSPRSTDHGTICADIYVFDANQRMIECCNCPVTANGELELSIRNDLTGNPITGVTWMGSSRNLRARSPPFALRYHRSPGRYGPRGAVSTAGVSRIEADSRPRRRIHPSTAAFAAWYTGDGNTDES